MNSDWAFAWCRTAEQAKRLARLFSANLTPEYISHSELMGRRAKSPTEWNPDVTAIIEADLFGRIANPLDPAPAEQTLLLVALMRGSAEAGVFLVTFSRAAAEPFALLEDMMMTPATRGAGAGSAFIEWVSNEARQRGIRRLFLESGINNHRAHEFFDRQGFEKISVVMMKELD